VARIPKDAEDVLKPVRIALGIGFVVAGLVALFLVISFLLPGEYQIQAEVMIPRSPEQVWHGFTQTERWIEWFSGIRSVNRTSVMAQGVGSRLQIVSVLHGGKEVVSAVEVTDWVEGKLYAHRHLSDIMKGGSLPITNARARFEFEPVGREKTRVVFTRTFEAHGLINKGFAWFVAKPRIEKAMSQTLSEFNRHIEEAEREHRR
jgi:uncharacterized protein YndB with AHSA1/START domain